MFYDKVINSYGIGCCRWNNFSKNMEILMVKKRVTYHFLDFVLNKYDYNDINSITKLLSNMNIDEKLILKYMDFKKIWFKAWLEDIENPNIELMRLRKYHKFENKFKEMLAKIKAPKFIELLNITSHNDNMWEIPKGKKLNRHEKTLNCAIREFSEETNYNINNVKIIDNKMISVKKNVKNILYIFNYYIGYSLQDFNITNIKKPIDKIKEISDVKWLSLNDIKLLNTNKKIIFSIESIFSILKNDYNICKLTNYTNIIKLKNNTSNERYNIKNKYYDDTKYNKNYKTYEYDYNYLTIYN